MRRNVRRNLGWLAGLSFALACSVNNSNLDLDASTCPRCVGSGGNAATGGQPGAGGATATGGTTASGGQPGSGGNGQSGGAPGTGGNGQSGGATGTGGAGVGTGGAAGAGGSAGLGGNNGKGGQGGKAGQGGETCDMLATDYANALATAKKCFAGAPNQCQQLVDDTIGCSNCREYVNDATTLNAIESQWTKQGCATGHLCSTIASCVTPPTSCVAGTSSGPGPGTGAGTCENSLVGTAGP